MAPRTNGFLVGVLCFAVIGALPSRATVTPVYDARWVEAEVGTLEGPEYQDMRSPAVPMQDFDDAVSLQSLSTCEANGELAFFEASTGAGQDSFLTPVQLSATVNATAQLPDMCQLDTSWGFARSHFEIGFTTDIAYRFIINPIGNFENPVVQLADNSGGSEVMLYDYSGSGPLGYDQVLSPGSYVFRVVAQAVEDGDRSNIYATLNFWEVPPTTGAGSVSMLTLAKAAGGDLSLAWQPSCSSDDDDYGIYAGDLGVFTSHTSIQCGTSGTTSATITPAAGNRYFLLVPQDGTEEGSYGTDSDGFERTVGASVCGTQQIASPCP